MEDMEEGPVFNCELRMARRTNMLTRGINQILSITHYSVFLGEYYPLPFVFKKFIKFSLNSFN